MEGLLMKLCCFLRECRWVHVLNVHHYGLWQCSRCKTVSIGKRVPSEVEERERMKAVASQGQAATIRHNYVNDHPLLKRVYDLCQAIEAIPIASPEETHAVTLAGNLSKPIADLANRVTELENDLSQSRSETLERNYRLGDMQARLTELQSINLQGTAHLYSKDTRIAELEDGFQRVRESKYLRDACGIARDLLHLN